MTSLLLKWNNFLKKSSRTSCLRGLFLISTVCILLSFTQKEQEIAEKLTIITTTSPILSNPGTEMLEMTQRSLYHVPELRACKKIIVFDGVHYNQRYRALAYELYIENVKRLISENPDFYHTTLVINREHKHLANSLKEAMQLVDTPYVFVHQHDFMLTRGFDLIKLIDSMDKNLNLKHIRFNRFYNQPNHWDGEIDEVVIGGTQVPLLRTFGWSDNDHIARADYYHTFVFPKVEWNGAMEWFLHDTVKIHQDHLSYGTYIYGSFNEAPYLYHLDGKSFQSE